MREDLDINNIMSSDEIDDLFSDSIESNEDVINEDQDANKTPEQKENNKEKEQTTEVNVDALFTDKPESVSSGEENTSRLGKMLILIRMLLPKLTSTLPLLKP